MKEVIDVNLLPEKEPPKEKKKLDKKKMLSIFASIIIILLLIISSIIYATNKQFRTFMDTYFFRKDVTENNVPTIEIDYDANTNIIPYEKYIGILSENILALYNSSGKKEKEVKIEINTPIYDTNGRYLIIGEKNNQKVYLISGNSIIWEKKIDSGNISKVSVNRNGYTSVVITGTTHKSVIITYDEKGNEMFKMFLSNTIAVDTAVSPDNQYLAFAEINTTGTVIQSNIKIISTSKASNNKSDDEDSEPIVYTYASEQGNLALKIKYQDRNKLMCMYDNSICLIENNTVEEIYKLNESNKKITFADIELKDFAFRTIEKSSGLFQVNTVIEMENISNKKQNIYTIEEAGATKNVASHGDVIAINLGSEVHFVNTNGWLVKKYTSSQGVRKIVICDNLAGIIYKDKIELVSL